MLGEKAYGEGEAHDPDFFRLHAARQEGEDDGFLILVSFPSPRQDGGHGGAEHTAPTLTGLVQLRPSIVPGSALRM